MAHQCQQCGSPASPVRRATTELHVADYRDEHGNHHRHDPNWTNVLFRCDNGHEWTESDRSVCPHEPCAWNGEVPQQLIFAPVGDCDGSGKVLGSWKQPAWARFSA